VRSARKASGSDHSAPPGAPVAFAVFRLAAAGVFVAGPGVVRASGAFREMAPRPHASTHNPQPSHAAQSTRM
jgi:hypothetical protein